MGDELLIALALVMVIEGVFPALNPRAFRRTVLMLSSMSERFLRGWGLGLMLLGAVLMYFVKTS